MKHLLEFHDSEIQSYSEDSDNLSIHMSGCIHASEEDPGFTQGTCYYQNTVIELIQFELIDGTLLAQRIADGFVLDIQDNEINLHLPLKHNGLSTLVISFANGSSLQILSRSISINSEGLKSNVEQFIP